MVVDSSNDIEPLIDSTIISQFAYWATLILGFIFVYFELTKTFSYFLPLQTPVLTIMWLLSSVYFLKRYLKSNKQHFLVLAFSMLIIMLLKLFVNDFSMWDYNKFVYSDAPLLVLMRLLDYGFIVGLLAYFLSKVGNVQQPINFQIILRAVIPSLIFVYITLETNTFFHWKVPSFQSSSLSIVWSLFAIAMLILGIWKTNRGWRYSGLALFSVVVCKVFLFDLAAMEMIYRVIAFMIVGMLLIAGSFVYIKSSNKFTIKGSDE
jgi:uncharacterized membrane protein